MTFFSKPESALLILGHGSTENPDSSTPCWEHAGTIAAQSRFGSVHCAFWKEEPSLRQIWPMIEEKEVYIVPNFISEGYFTQEVLPRELELTGPTTTRLGHVIHYCEPVGCHPAMTDLLTKRAMEAVDETHRPEDTALIIVGHGTGLNEKSREAVRTQVESLRKGPRIFADILDAYMEEAPYVSDWTKLTSASNVVVVPFFIADGLHSYQDIPVLLGIESEPGAAASQREVFRHNPHHINGRTLWYSPAIGTDSSLADIIMDQVIAFDAKYVS